SVHPVPAVVPSPAYPELQAQVWGAPTLLLQVAKAWQPPLLVKHSSMSLHAPPADGQV
ncbi:MAG: hypothetical protein ACI9WU_005251, partial [Myxococcota bacterium]